MSPGLTLEEYLCNAPILAVPLLSDVKILSKTTTKSDQLKREYANFIEFQKISKQSFFVGSLE